MKIEFNTSRVPQMESSQPVAKRSGSSVASDAVSFSASDSLKAQLNNISTVRPEQVARAKQLVSGGEYPPNYVLDRIAVLLAVHSKSNSSG
jgi:hypothetical protein